MRRLIIALGSAIVVIVLAGVAVSFVAWERLNTALELPEDGILYEVPSGSPLASVTRDLRERGILTAPRLLDWFARLRGDATRIHAGEYKLKPGLTPLGLLDQLIRGEVYMHQLTVIEGWKFSDFLEALRSHPAVVASDLTPEEIMTALGEPGVPPEGQFLPDTYVFPKGTTDLEILRWSHEALWKELDSAWAARSPEIAVGSEYEALIIASIVEKETALPAERGLIAGVFHERLKRGMRLQTDPTVIYGLGEDFDGNLTRRHLETDGPYNTYTRRGLPPTPIALAGRASIVAATRPEMSGALYFVATGRPDGSHHFSPTLEEHNRAVREFLDRQREASR